MGQFPEDGVTVAYRIEWSDESCNWRAEPEFATWAPPEAVGRPIDAQGFAFQFMAPSAGLDRLLVKFATWGRTNTAPVWCELSDGAQILARGFVDPQSIQDNQYIEILDLRGIPLVAGRRYAVLLSSPLARAGDGFVVWTCLSDLGRHTITPRIAGHRNARTLLAPAPVPTTGLMAIYVADEQTSDAQVHRDAASLGSTFPGQTFLLRRGETREALWDALRNAQVVAFSADFARTQGLYFDHLCFELYRRGVCTLFLGSPWPSNVLPAGSELKSELHRQSNARRCRYILAERSIIDTDRGENLAIQSGGPTALADLHAHSLSDHNPSVAVISTLYRKSATLEAFVDHIIRQSYTGLIRIILVDDASPDHDLAVARRYAQYIEETRSLNRSLQLVENPANIGNCASRMKGIEAIEADIYIVIDSDCLINRDFVAAHVFEHARAGIEAVIGPINIESWNSSPITLLRELELHPDHIAGVEEPQDPVQPDGFLNCITRNFSIKREAARREPLFDIDFSYSSAPGSGFGWEDVEMGYRLYLRGGAIAYTRYAFSVHCSHVSSVGEGKQVVGSLQNFNKLFVKHPDLALVARRWAVRTYDVLANWADSLALDGGPARQALSDRFESERVRQAPLLRAWSGGVRQLRVLSYRWHAAHQYEIYKLPHQFTLATSMGNGMIDRWAHEQRPLRPNVQMRMMADIDPRDFDVAILHFDENVFAPDLSNGIMPPHWGEPFQQFLALPDIPKVAICHGTPPFVGQYGVDPGQKAEFELHDEERERLRTVLAGAGVWVVCNSWQALKEWAFANSRVIWHGFDPQEFPEGRHDRGVLTLEPDRHRPHYRGAWEHQAVMDRLDAGIAVSHAPHPGAALDPRDSSAFAARNFRAYARHIGRFRYYLNTTLRSPMPRSRGEAMMTGVIPVSLNNHDVGRFVDSWKNGVVADQPGELADALNYLHRHPTMAIQMARAARHTALDVFNHDRFLKAWIELLREATE